MIQRNKILKTLRFLSKIFFILALFYFLIQKKCISISETQQALKNWKNILPATLGLLLCSLLGILRWQLLLKTQKIKLKWSRILQIAFIGNFFNIALPGAVSGDVMKAFYVGKELPGNQLKAFGSILFDRVVGLSALIFISGIALIIDADHFWNHPFFKTLQFILIFSIVIIFLGYCYLFVIQEKQDPFLKGLLILEKKFPLTQMITSFYQSLRSYHQSHTEVLLAFIVSTIIHIIVGWCCFQYAIALNQLHISLISIYVIVPLGLLVTSIPIAPAGIGTGNFAFLYLFHVLNSERGADIFSLLAMTNIFIGCLGGIFYVRFKARF